LLWAVGKDVAQQLAEVMGTFVDAESPYAPSYPMPLQQDALRETIALGVPTGYHEANGKHTLVFASKREKVEEELLPPDEVPEQWLKAGFTQFYGKKRKVFQVFDSITTIPALGLVEMRIDQAKVLSERDVLQFKDGLCRRFNDLVKGALGIERVLGHQSGAWAHSSLQG